jgi:hypothetical protein
MSSKKNPSAFERMQQAGLSVDQLREVVAGARRADFIERVRAAGLTLEEMKEIVHKSSETNTGSASVGTSVSGVPGVSPPSSAGGASTQG